MSGFAGGYGMGGHEHGIDAKRLIDAGREAWHGLPFLLPSCIAIGFGLVLLQPADSFALSPAFVGMQGLIHSENVWGAIFIVLGAAKLTSLIFRWSWRVVAGLALAALYLFVSGTFIWAVGFTSTGTIAYGGLAALSLWGPFHGRCH